MALCGFQFGNHRQAGCLTRDDSVRLHSCEHGTQCSTLENSRKVVWIIPVISRSREGIIPELGAGGGGGDLMQIHELELADTQAYYQLFELCRSHIKDHELLDQTIRLVQDALRSRRRTVALNQLDSSLTEDAIPLKSFAHLLSKVAIQENSVQECTGFSLHARHRLDGKPILVTLEPNGEFSSHLVIIRASEQCRTDMISALSLLPAFFLR